MADNFDANVARRKPNTASSRPVHPWDVSLESPSEKEKDTPSPPSVPIPMPQSDTIQSSPTEIADTPPSRATSPTPVSESSRKQKPSRRSADLSDSINIHSNFCKLDNDISDHLMQRLSASAQSVYLRL